MIGVRPCDSVQGRSAESDVLTLAGVRLIRDGKTILDGIDWRVRPGEHWVMLGPNGSGKTSLCQIISFYVHPSDGSVSVLGGELGHVDVRSLRRRIGLTSAALAAMVRCPGAPSPASGGVGSRSASDRPSRTVPRPAH